MDIRAALQQLKDHKELHQLSLVTIMAFISLATSLKHDIMQPQPLFLPQDQSPDILPPSIVYFLSQSLAIPLTSIQECWHIFKFNIWDHPGPEAAHKVEEASF